MSMPATAPQTPASTAADALHTLRANWGWFVALGVVFVVLGFIALANLLLSTVATALYVGALVLVGGVVQVIHAFRVKTWGRFFFWLLAGILYAVAGGLMMYQPLLAAGVITLLLGVSLAVEGGFRIAAGIGARPSKGWGWIVVSGLATLLLGIVIVVGWPLNTLFLLGLFLGIDLVINGVGTILFGFALREKGQTGASGSSSTPTPAAA